ncbi:general secretion pathway protein GspK [Candidatus Omnitrophota bacterium]
MKKGDYKRGSILIIALWSLCLLTTFVVYSGLAVRQKLSLIDRLDSRDSLHFMGEAGVNAAILELRRKDQEDGYYALNEGWSNSPAIFDKAPVGLGSFTIGYSYDEGSAQKARYGLLDETSKININKADAKVLTRLLVGAAGLNEQRALDLAYCIIDWRDSDSFFQHPQYGAEDGDYKGLNEPYEAKDADFEVKEELLLIRGMNREIFNNIDNFVTIYGEGVVNINTAPRQVLLALGLRGGLVEKILSFRKGDDLAAGTYDDNVFSGTGSIVPNMTQVDLLSASEVGELTNFISGDTFTTSSTDFTVKCLASLKTKKETSEVTAVVSYEGFVRYWWEEY